MDQKQLLTKSITLLYRESLIADRVENSSDTVRVAMESLSVPQIVVGINNERDIIRNLKQTALQMCANPLDTEYIKEDLLLTIKSNCMDDDALYEQIAQGINQDMPQAVLKRSVIGLRKDLINHFKEESVEKVLRESFFQFKHQRDKIRSFTGFVADVITKLEPYQIQTSRKDPAINESVSFEDEEGVENVFNTACQEGNGNGVMRTGYQALNDMLDGGFRPGEYVMFMALQHKWKTGLSLSLFKQFPIYNKPYLIDKTRKPLLIRISFEDPLKMNFQFLYKSFKENETGLVYHDEFNISKDANGEEIKTPKISAKEKAKYVIDHMKVNGWHVEFLGVNPIEWTYRDLCNLIIEREAAGYEVKVCMVDYLLKLPTTGCTQGPTGTDLRNLNERLKAFFAPRGCIFITPWQLSGEAKALVRDNTPDVVTRWVGGGFTDGCKSLDHVVDVGILTHLVCKDREWYLDVALDKLRRVDQPEDQYRRFALKFNNVKGAKGVILDDINKENSAYKKPGGDRVIAIDDSKTYFDF